MRTFVDFKQNTLEIHTPVKKTSTMQTKVELTVPTDWSLDKNTFSGTRLYGLLSKHAYYYSKRGIVPETIERMPDGDLLKEFAFFAHKYNIFLRRKLSKVDNKAEASKLAKRIAETLAKFRDRKNTDYQWFVYVDELLSWKTEQKILAFLKKTGLECPNLLLIVECEKEYRRKKLYAVDTTVPAQSNRLYHNWSFIVSHITTVPECVEYGTKHIHAFASIAAAIAMTFSTGATFVSYFMFGTWTVYFFIVAIISYIFKDRMKEIIRNWAVLRFGPKFKYLYSYKDDFGRIPLVSKENVAWKDCDEHILEVKSLYKAFDNMPDTYSNIRGVSYIHLNSLLACAPTTKQYVYKLTSKKRIKVEKVPVEYTLELKVIEENEVLNFSIHILNGKITNIDKL